MKIVKIFFLISVYLMQNLQADKLWYISPKLKYGTVQDEPVNLYRQMGDSTTFNKGLSGGIFLSNYLQVGLDYSRNKLIKDNAIMENKGIELVLNSNSNREASLYGVLGIGKFKVFNNSVQFHDDYFKLGMGTLVIINSSFDLKLGVEYLKYLEKIEFVESGNGIHEVNLLIGFDYKF